MSNKILPSLFLIIAALLAAILMPVTARAQMDDWNLLADESGAFEGRFPKDFTFKQHQLRIDDNTVLFDSEAVANIKEKGKSKTYMLKLEQKIGSPMTNNMIAFALNGDIMRYAKMAKSLGGKINRQDDINLKGFRGKDIFINYTKDKMTMGIRVRILFTDISRIYMVASGAADGLYSFRTNSFFENIKLYDKNAHIPGKFGEDWETYTSPKKIFTIKAPPKDNPYLLVAPKFNSSEKGESVEVFYTDPILRYKNKYVVTSYILQKRADLNIMKIIFADHTKKYIEDISPESLKLEEVKLADRTIYTARASVPTTTENPNTNFVMFEAHVHGNIVALQEFSGAQNQVLSPLGISIFANFDFHPNQYQENAKEEAATKEDNKQVTTKVPETKQPEPAKQNVPAPTPDPSPSPQPAPTNPATKP